MRYEFGTCQECGEDNRVIVNKSRQLCQVCNYMRLHPDGNKKAEGWKYKPPKRRTKAQERIEKKLQEIYRQMAQIRPRRCSGCGKQEGGNIKLSHSHLIPRSQRRDLICDPRNIKYHCLTIGYHRGCHEIWESVDRVNLLDYEVNMQYIQLVDEGLYNKMLLNQEKAATQRRVTA